VTVSSFLFQLLTTFLITVNADWYKGHLESNPSRIGFFPANYVRKEPARPSEQGLRFLAPPAPQSTSIAQPSYQLVPPPHQPVYGQPAPMGSYQPYPNPQQHQGGYNAPPATLQPGSQDQLALAPVPYTQGAMTTTAVTPGGTNAVVTNTETGKQSKFKLKPGSMKSTVRFPYRRSSCSNFAHTCWFVFSVSSSPIVQLVVLASAQERV
jgi:hypothetical protein